MRCVCQPPNEVRERIVIRWANHKMPVVGHQTVAQKWQRKSGVSFDEYPFKRLVVLKFFKQRQPCHGSVEHVETNSTRTYTGATRHTGRIKTFPRDINLISCVPFSFRRLIERGVRFVHLCHGDWDHHSHLRQGIASQALQTDQACAALIHDLKQRGLLDDTLVVWGGEFGRTAVGQKTANADVGRDHQISAFTMWLAGGGIRAGQTVGETDELGCFPVTKSVHVHDLHATMLHLLGLDHKRLTHRFQGRDFRLTDVAGQVVAELIA